VPLSCSEAGELGASVELEPRHVLGFPNEPHSEIPKKLQAVLRVCVVLVARSTLVKVSYD